MNQTALTITTINVPLFLEGLCQNINDHGHVNDTTIIIIADKKTPSGAEVYCQNTAKKYKIDLDYLDIETQEYRLKEYTDLLNLFPYHTPDRVILGGMLSYIYGCERLIAVDDDNYSTENDFVGFHNITGSEIELNLINNESGWFNVHNALVEEQNIPFYPRGYPWEQRNSKSNERFDIKKVGKVVVNQGLVLEDPDIDAISRLFWPIRAIAMNDKFDPQFGLNPGVWSPFNYQNTSLFRDLIPCYYRPISTLRNADIWTAYIFNKLTESKGHIITFGKPLVKQIRNPHNLWDDLDVELINNRATDNFIELLRRVKIQGNTYFDLLGDLIDKCQNEMKSIDNILLSEKKMICDFLDEYKVWYNIISKII